MQTIVSDKKNTRSHLQALEELSVNNFMLYVKVTYTLTPAHLYLYKCVLLWKTAMLQTVTCLYCKIERATETGWESLMPHKTQYRSLWRRSSQPITWLTLTKKTGKYTPKRTGNMKKVKKIKYSTHTLIWFSHHWWHSARKWGALIIKSTGAILYCKLCYLTQTQRSSSLPMVCLCALMALAGLVIA